MSAPRFFPSTAENEQIEAYSLDYDGCADQFGIVFLTPGVATEEWIDAFGKTCHFIQEIKKAIANNVKVVLLNGSNRQDLPADSRNRFNCVKIQNLDNGSCFHFLSTLESYCQKNISPKIILDTFLMPDIQDEKIAQGKTFVMALAESLPVLPIDDQTKKMEILGQAHQKFLANPNTPRYNFDQTKVSLIYAQVHHLVALYGNKPITLKFFDDRARFSDGTPDICENLFLVFTNHPELIPQQVTLVINHYLPDNSASLGVAPTQTWTIQGKGEYDKDFAKNNLSLVDLIKQVQRSDTDPIKTADLLKAVANFKMHLLENKLQGISITDEKTKAAAKM